jgi:hypothetical protein
MALSSKPLMNKGSSEDNGKQRQLSGRARSFDK